MAWYTRGEVAHFPLFLVRTNMNRLHALRKSLLEMSPEELREHIRRIRAERRVIKVKPSTKRKAKVKSNRSAAKVVNMLHTLTPEELKLLLGEVDEHGSPDDTDQPDNRKGPSTS
jgi:hypothetical protein